MIRNEYTTIVGGQQHTTAHRVHVNHVGIVIEPHTVRDRSTQQSGRESGRVGDRRTMPDNGPVRFTPYTARTADPLRKVARAPPVPSSDRFMCQCAVSVLGAGNIETVARRKLASETIDAHDVTQLLHRASRSAPGPRRARPADAFGEPMQR